MLMNSRGLTTSFPVDLISPMGKPVIVYYILIERNRCFCFLMIYEHRMNICHITC